MLSTVHLVFKNDKRWWYNTQKTKQKKSQRELEDDLNVIVREKCDDISEEQKPIIEKVNKIFDDYFTMVFEAKFKATHGKGHKIQNSKQILQRSLMPLPQVKAGNIFEIYISICMGCFLGKKGNLSRFFSDIFLN